MDNEITMKARKNEIKLIYNSSRVEEKRAVGYAEALKDHKLLTIDVRKEHITETQLAELANKLGVPIDELVNKNAELFKDEYADKDLEDEELLKVLSQNPDMLKTPIALMDQRAFFVTSSYDFVKEDMGTKPVPDDGSESEYKR